MINQKTNQIAKKLEYRPIKGLDVNRPYVLLAKKKNRQFVIKTDHFEDEAAILKILNQDDYFSKHHIIIPNLYEYSDQFLVQDFIKGRMININSRNFSHNLQMISNKLEFIHSGLNRKKKIGNLSKGWNDQFAKMPFQNSVWLKKRITRWFEDKQSKPKYRFTNVQNSQVMKLILKIKDQNMINFGAFSPAHIRIQNEKIGLFDFGHHIRWAPKQYDLAYLWWGLLFEIEHKRNEPEFWFKLAKDLTKSIPISERSQYWACILERLAGLSKDLTLSSHNQIPRWHKMILKIKNQLTPMAISELQKLLSNG